ncbi:MAG: ParB/RepB/Spo0J family partition protein [Solimonas sp.]
MKAPHGRLHFPTTTEIHMSKFHSAAELEQIRVIDLLASEANPRFELTAIEELGASIAAWGIIEPLIVQKKRGGGYTIIAGHRRAAAAQLAGLEAVPCIVRPDTDAAMLHLIENTQREALTPLETALGVGAALTGGKKMKQKALAAELSKSEGWVSKFATIARAYHKLDDDPAAFEPWKAETDAEKLYKKARKALGLDKKETQGELPTEESKEGSGEGEG